MSWKIRFVLFPRGHCPSFFQSNPSPPIEVCVLNKAPKFAERFQQETLWATCSSGSCQKSKPRDLTEPCIVFKMVGIGEGEGRALAMAWPTEFTLLPAQSASSCKRFSKSWGVILLKSSYGRACSLQSLLSPGQYWWYLRWRQTAYILFFSCIS